MQNRFIFENQNLTPAQLTRVRANNAYLYTVISSIVANKGELTAAKRKIPKYVNQAAAGKLSFPDSVTNVNTNHLGAKFRFLLTELDSSPKAREEFCKSAFYTYFKELFIGSCANGIEWDDFKRSNSKNVPSFTVNESSALVNALNIYINEPGTAVGIDMSKAIDTIVKQAPNGQYKLQSTDDLKECGELYDAVVKQTKILQSTKGFKECYNFVEQEEERE